MDEGGTNGSAMAKRKRGRPPKIHVDPASTAGLSPEDLVDALTQAIAGSIEQLRLKARGGHLTPKELMAAGKLSRTLETCARAKRQLLDIGKDADLSGIPTEQLARVVVRAMRNDPELKGAIAAEMNRGAEA